MSDPRPDAPPRPPVPPTPPAYQNTPNAEKYVLEADAMRQRQLRSALLHGSGRTWREHPRTWPAVVVGLIAVALVCGGLTIKDAFRLERDRKAAEERKQAAAQREQEAEEDRRDREEREREQEDARRATPGPSSPTASAPGSVPTTPVPSG